MGYIVSPTFKPWKLPQHTEAIEIMHRLQLLKSLRSTRLALSHRPCRTLPPQARAAFSTSGRRDIMSMTGFTEEQLMVRESISQICSKFPNTYWQERDQLEKDPKEFHAALAKDGWLGIALPESLGGAGLGVSH